MQPRPAPPVFLPHGGMIPPGMLPQHGVVPPGMMAPLPYGYIPGMPIPPGMVAPPGIMPMPGRPIPGMPPMAYPPQATPNAGPSMMPGMAPNFPGMPAWGYAPVGAQSSNPACVISMTVYVGNLPDDVDDKIIQGMLEICGKFKKWNRPVDTNNVRRRFGFVTFEKGVGAMRCFRVLNGFEIGGKVLVVKAGTRETASLISITKTEEEELSIITRNSDAASRGVVEQVVASAAATTSSATTAATVPMELNSLDLEVKDRIVAFLEQSKDDANRNAVSDLVREISEAGTDPVVAVEAVSDAEVGDEEEERERMARSEILRFRASQMQRDKQLAEERQRRLTQRLQQLAAEQRKADEAKRKVDTDVSGPTDGHALGEKRKLENGGSDGRLGPRQRIGELEVDAAKMLRRRQVLAAISDDLGDGGAVFPAVPSIKKVGLKLGGTSNAAAKNKSSSNLNVFGENDDSSAAQARTIIPIDYTDDEKLAVQGVMSHASEHQSEAGNIANKAKLARQKEIADSIPVSKEGLFAFEINWAVSEAHGIAEKIMRPWIIKKIKEYLGEEETVLINFIVTKLSNPCVPDDLLTELTPVLDVDAEPFVLKLWRMFVFSVLKAADQ